MQALRNSTIYSITLSVVAALVALLPAEAGAAPYPPSQVIKAATWDTDTHRTDAGGSDLWPTTWGAIYTGGLDSFNLIKGTLELKE